MTPQSAKAKGRMNQQRFRDMLLGIDPEGMYESRSMGSNGSDIIDPAHRLPWKYIELRKNETYPSLNSVVKEMSEKGGARWLYAIRRNRQDGLYMMNEAALLAMLEAWLSRRVNK